VKEEDRRTERERERERWEGERDKEREERESALLKGFFAIMSSSFSSAFASEEPTTTSTPVSSKPGLRRSPSRRSVCAHAFVGTPFV
jgi:hypothetical protein